MEQSEFERRFKYHPPQNEEQKQKYETLRFKFKNMAEAVLAHCPDSRERSLAFTKIEEAMMWANASIARNE